MNDPDREFRAAAYDEYRRYCGREPVAPGSTGNPYHRRLIRRHLRLSPDSSILEIGCGDGGFLEELQRAGFRNLRGVDLSAEQVAQARAKGLAGVASGDSLAYLRSCDAASVSAVVALDMMEHLTRSEAFEVGREVFRVLIPRGRWIVHVPNAESPLFGRIRYGDLTHEMAYTASSLSQLFRMVGFVRFAFFEDTPVVHGPGSLLRRVAWHALRTLLRTMLFVETGRRGTDAIFSQGVLAIADKT